MNRIALATLAFLVIALPASPAAAFGTDGKTALQDWFHFSLGVKGTGGANVWTEPTGVFGNQEVFYAKARAGAAGGAGLWFEARFVRYLAIEADLIYEWDSIWETATFNGIVKVATAAVRHNLRIPLLVKGVLPLPGFRMTLGVGPEWVVPIGTDALKTTTLPPQVVLQNQIDFAVTAPTSTMLTLALGFVVELPFNLRMPIDLRASYNLGQSKAYSDRAKLVTTGTDVSVKLDYENSWDFRFQLGLGYEF